MKTAEEIVCEFNGLGELSDNELILIEKIKEYAREACKEQRKICFKKIYNARPNGRVHATGGLYYQSMSQMKLRDIIINAPEPELE